MLTPPPPPFLLPWPPLLPLLLQGAPLRRSARPVAPDLTPTRQVQETRAVFEKVSLNPLLLCMSWRLNSTCADSAPGLPNPLLRSFLFLLLHWLQPRLLLRLPRSHCDNAMPVWGLCDVRSLDAAVRRHVMGRALSGQVLSRARRENGPLALRF